nr:uncharacterized protein LOC109155647 [Ipomoea batatas]
MVVSPLYETISKSPTPAISSDCDARHSADDLHLLPADALHSAVTCSKSHRRRPRTPLSTPPLISKKLEHIPKQYHLSVGVDGRHTASPTCTRLPDLNAAARPELLLPDRLRGPTNMASDSFLSERHVYGHEALNSLHHFGAVCGDRVVQPENGDDRPLVMYPYLDFFNEPENQMEDSDDPEAGDRDLRSHLNARMGSDRAHPVEPPAQEPINVIHEVPIFPQAVGQTPYQYPMNPMGVPDLNYPWWQGTPQYYPPPYQFPPGIYPWPTYFPMPEVSPNPVNPELRRVQSERRPSAPYPDPSGLSRAPLPTHTEAAEATEYESP